MAQVKVRRLSFPGEASFIVRRRGNKKFVLAIGAPAVTDEGVVLNPPVLGDTSGGGTGIVMSPPVMYETYAWDSMDCASIKNAIASIENLIATGKFTPETIAYYQGEIAKGKAVYDSKCKAVATDISPAPTGGTGTGTGGATPTTTITTSALPVFVAPSAGSSLTGLKGGGGGGGSTSSSGAVVTKKNNNWIWWVVAAGVAYLMLRKKK